MNLAVLALALLAYAPTRDPGQALEPEQEARVIRLGRELRCAVCQGLSIADSQAPMAQAQLTKVRELVLQGKNDDEIFDYFVAGYGEWILLRPRTGGLNWGLWIGPIAFLVIGIVLVVLKSPKGTTAPAPAPGPSAEATADDEYLKRVRADVEK